MLWWSTADHTSIYSVPDRHIKALNLGYYRLRTCRAAAAMSVSVCVSGREHISAATYSIFSNFCGSVLLCYVLPLSCIMSYLQRLTSLRRRAQDNALAASYWLRRRRASIDESIVQGVPGAQTAMHHCRIALFCMLPTAVLGGWRRCNTLWTSGFADDVKFAHVDREAMRQSGM